MNALAVSMVVLSLAFVTQVVDAQTAAPDNTKSNKLDQSNTAMSADSQKNDNADLMLTQNIRKSVVSDKTLSTYAHNVKIVAINGTVTLNGVVRSQTEKSTVESKAAAIAGAGHVVNDIKIAPAS